MNEFDVIYTYTRKEAIEDGEQTCISEIYPNDCRLFKYPVYFTRKVMSLLENSQDPGAVVWDICYMSINSSSRIELSASTIKFSVIIENAEIKPDFVEDGLPFYTLICQVGATDFDDRTPAVTVMFPDEL